jgi:hypothetical protein
MSLRPAWDIKRDADKQTNKQHPKTAATKPENLLAEYATLKKEHYNK